MAITAPPVKDITLSRAARDVLKSIDVLNAGLGMYGGGTLRHYLWLIASGEHTLQGLSKSLGVTASQASRATRTLSKVNYNGDPGQDLVNITFDLYNPRVKLIELNQKGVELLKAEYKAITGRTIM